MASQNFDKQNISVARVLAWMIVFLLLYFPLMLMVLAAVLACAGGVVFGIFFCVSNSIIVGASICILTCVFGYILVYPFFMAILRPFYTLYKDHKERGLEVTAEEAPELVELVYQIAELTGNEHPKHIYVSAAANAWVFFDTRFSNIFFHVQKNIEIGLFLFSHMSLAETASCIAHEFGHFSQDKMRWGTVVYILNTLITNMMNVNKRWEKIIKQMVDFPWVGGYGLAVNIIGWLLHVLTCGYTNAMKCIHKKIPLAYLDLSRKMEYEADDVAARIAGSSAFISFAYKVAEISNRHDIFTDMVRRMASRNQLVRDYWDAYARTDKYIAATTEAVMSWDTPLTESPRAIVDNQLMFDSINSTHPDWISRIYAVRTASYPGSTTFVGRAWDIVPAPIKDRVSCQSIENLRKLCDSEKPVVTIENEKLEEIIRQENYWRQYAVYFQRDIIEFDYEDCEPIAAFLPCDRKNLAVIRRYLAAKEDYENAQSIKVKRNIRRVTYKGVSYNLEKIPMDTIKEEYELWRDEAAQIDRSICGYAMSHVADVGIIKQAYRRLFYAQSYISTFDFFVCTQQEETAEVLNSCTSEESNDQFEKVQKALEDLNMQFFTYGIEGIDKNILETCAPKEVIDCLNAYLSQRQSMFTGTVISRDSIELLFKACDWTRRVHDDILGAAKMEIIDACLNRNEGTCGDSFSQPQCQ